ncbi:MAG: cytochrome P450 [Streptosporangiaceae bacterium]|nr:cytochrome P450 [Streptosporangiaceae bacterium]
MSDHTREVALAKGALPIVGHGISLLRNARRFLSSLPEQGDVVELRLGPSRAYVVCNAELTHQVLVNDRIFEKGGPIVERLREFIGDSVSTSLRPEHRRLRRLIQPAFSSNRLADYMKTMRDETVGVIEQWQDGEVLDVYAGMQAITARIAARTMFAAPASSALIEQAHAALNEIVKGAGRRMLIPPPFDWIPTRGKRRYDQACRSIRGASKSWGAF